MNKFNLIENERSLIWSEALGIKDKQSQNHIIRERVKIATIVAIQDRDERSSIRDKHTSLCEVKYFSEVKKVQGASKVQPSLKDSGIGTNQRHSAANLNSDADKSKLRRI